MSLRRALETVPKVSLDFGWRKPVLAQQAENLARHWGDREATSPKPFDLEATLKAVKESWARSRSLDTLSRRERRFLPYVLFYPPGRQQEWVGADPKFAHAFVDSLRDHPRSIASTAFVLLRDYPRMLDTFEFLRSYYSRRLQADDSIRTQEWRRRHVNYRLFAPDGPSSVAKQLCDGEAAASEMLTDAGLVNELGVGAFMREVHAHVLEILESRLEEQADEPALKQPIGFLRTDRERLRFEDLAGDVGNALLLPHARVIPLPKTRNLVQGFLLEHLLDPRIHPRKWQAVDPEARTVFLRWLVGATLEDFFRLIGKHAFMQHWEYREAFWNAYLQQGVIDDACVVLGEEARALALQAFRNEGLVYSRLSGGQRNHSVLLLRIGTLTIAEWSHNGKCRVWFTSQNRHRPGLHQGDYSRGSLMSGADYEQVHHASQYYTWQQNLASVIAREAGIRVWQHDYMVR